MSKLYRHRVNTIEELRQIPHSLGIEFDLRSDGDRVIITHEPFTSGPDIEEYFPHIGGRPCIFNVKCEGIEARVLDLAKRYNIEDFFFLDCSVPAAVKLLRSGESRIAVRYSEYEPCEWVLGWAGKARWVWADCFTAYPGDEKDWQRIAERFQICVVSPELQGHGSESIGQFRATLAGRRFDAACTKRPDLWSKP
ncbi:MAG: hypothetical protein QME66_06510 [Candidatus Eisenbacteria bacterium]|nr:hypothetical protein [Candidatus Eisenbacteria bacterium]